VNPNWYGRSPAAFEVVALDGQRVTSSTLNVRILPRCESSNLWNLDRGQARWDCTTDARSGEPTCTPQCLPGTGWVDLNRDDWTTTCDTSETVETWNFADHTLDDLGQLGVPPQHAADGVGDGVGPPQRRLRHRRPFPLFPSRVRPEGSRSAASCA
jgi:hypothetical protein